MARSLSVMPGDTIKMEVYAKYVDPNSSNWTGALNTLMSQIAANTAGVVVDGAAYGSSTASFPAGYGIPVGKDGNSAPKAYLNWLIFDRNHQYVTGGFKPVTSAAKEAGGDVAHEKLTPTGGYVAITEPGYVYVYLSNEETNPVEVYFDDFKVTQIKSPVIATSDYYPFGLQTSNSYTRKNALQNNFLFNGKELQTSLSLNWFDYGARMYDPAIGRFAVVDKFADRFARYSLYAYATNNPVLFTDPDGNYPVNIVSANGILTRAFMYLINTTLGISYNTLASTKISYDKDLWYHPHSFTGYESGGITLHNNVVLTDDFDTKGGSMAQTRSDVEKWFGLIPHELGHRVQRDRSMFAENFTALLGIENCKKNMILIFLS